MKKFLKRFVPLLFGLYLFVTLPAVPALAKTPVLGSSVTNQCFSFPYSCAYDGKIYYAVLNKIYSIEKDGTDRKEICTVKEGKGLASLTTLGNSIYALLKSAVIAPYGTLVQINPDGTGYKIYKGEKFAEIENLCAANGKLYYDKWGKKHHCIYAINPDGSKRKLLVKDANFEATDGKVIYYKPRVSYGRNTEDKIFRCHMNGKNSVEVVSFVNYIWDFTVNGGYCYYAGSKDGTHFTVYKKNLKTNAEKKIYTGGGWLDIYADGKNVYFIDEKDYKLKKINTATGKSKTIKKQSYFIWGIFDELMVMENLPDETGRRDIVLVNRLTGEEIAWLGSYRLTMSAG